MKLLRNVCGGNAVNLILRFLEYLNATTWATLNIPRSTPVLRYKHVNDRFICYYCKINRIIKLKYHMYTRTKYERSLCYQAESRSRLNILFVYCILSAIDFLVLSVRWAQNLATQAVVQHMTWSLSLLLKGHWKRSHNQIGKNTWLNDFYQSMPIEDDDWEINKREGIGGREHCHI